MGMSEIVGVALLLGCVVVGLLAFRRLRMIRVGGVDVALRRVRASAPNSTRGWNLGVAKYQGDEFVWFRVISLARRPNAVLSRAELEIIDRRRPGPTEEYVVPASEFAGETGAGRGGSGARTGAAATGAGAGASSTTGASATASSAGSTAAASVAGASSIASTTGAASVSTSALAVSAAPKAASRLAGRAQRVIHHHAAPLTAAPANRAQSGDAAPIGTRIITWGSLRRAESSFSPATGMASSPVGIVRRNISHRAISQLRNCMNFR